MPSCVLDLAAACAPAGACTTNVAHDNWCFANGVTASYTGNSCTSSTGSTLRVNGADGALCFTFESKANAGMACESGTFLWRNADGQIVATGGGGGLGLTVTCAASGEKASCSGAGCGASTFDVSACVEGTCVSK